MLKPKDETFKNIGLEVMDNTFIFVQTCLLGFLQDRILFRCKKKNSISCLHYGAVETLKESDHRPVYAVFEVELRPGRDKQDICYRSYYIYHQNFSSFYCKVNVYIFNFSIPLCGGQFDREIWLQGKFMLTFLNRNKMNNLTDVYLVTGKTHQSVV